MASIEIIRNDIRQCSNCGEEADCVIELANIRVNLCEDCFQSEMKELLTDLVNQVDIL